MERKREIKKNGRKSIYREGKRKEKISEETNNGWREKEREGGREGKN